MSKITESAKGEKCQIRIPGICNFDPSTTVWCHANGYAPGKPLGGKSDDRLGSYGCNLCHDLYDRRMPLPPGMTREYVDAAFAEGHYRSFLILGEKGCYESGRAHQEVKNLATLEI